MELFITIEGQNSYENGFFEIFRNVKNELSFITNKELHLENIDNYGTEFRIIHIIPTCVNDLYWDSLGWKERKYISRKNKEADIRLRLNYERFTHENPYNQRLMFIDIIVKSIEIVQNKSVVDFRGDELINDILQALNVTKEQLESLYNDY